MVPGVSPNVVTETIALLAYDDDHLVLFLSDHVLHMLTFLKNEGEKFENIQVYK